jgi:Protein of unknown function (DUF2914)/Arm DNA-binding domain
MEEITKLIDDLQPQATRYDTPIADDLLICTFPNGIRTWIFSYASNGYQRRRSLGVYPQMSLADARQALFAARKLQKVEDELAAHGLGGEVMRQAPAETAATDTDAGEGRRPWLDRRTISAGLAGGLMSVALLLTARALRPELFGLATAPRPPTVSAPAAVATAHADTSWRNSGAPAAAAATAPADTAASAPASETTAPQPGADDGATTTPVTTTPVAALSPANRALLKVQEQLRGSVAREVLARGVDGDRPVGTFDTQLALEPDAPTTLYYFTELRGMAGKTVLHRWLHDGHLVSEVSMQVGEGWLSTLHSSATIAPDMTGRWEVRVCDARGQALEQESFELTPTAVLSSR